MLTLQEAAQRAGLDASRLRRLIYSGDLRAQKLGTQWLVSPRELERFMALERPIGVHRAARQGAGR